MVPTLFFMHRRRAFSLYFSHPESLFACTIYVTFQNLAESGIPMIPQAACLKMEEPKITHWLKNLACHRYILFDILLIVFENDHYNVILIRKFSVTMIWQKRFHKTFKTYSFNFITFPCREQWKHFKIIILYQRQNWKAFRNKPVSFTCLSKMKWKK